MDEAKGGKKREFNKIGSVVIIGELIAQNNHYTNEREDIFN